MSIYRPDQRVQELEAEDEVFYSHHFANARKAWKEQWEVVDSTYHYKPDAQGVWGFSLGVPKSDYFWPKAILAGNK